MASLSPLLVSAWICSLALLQTRVTSQSQPTNGYHGPTNLRYVWPAFYHDVSSHVHREITTSSPWYRHAGLTNGLRKTAVPSRPQHGNNYRRRVGQALHDQSPAKARSEKFSALPTADYPYRDNHRYQQRDGVTENYQRLSTTPAVYTRHRTGRRVCTRHLANPSIQHHRGRQVRWSYSELSFAFLCCPGWMQVTQLSFGCNQPICSAPCLNGGVCSSPETCTCRKGFIGGQCETDVDECLSEKPCGQLCRNLPGSYECYCRPGYHLQQDGQSCRRNDTEDTAFEARDLENDYFHVELDESTTSAQRPAVPTSTHDTENEVGDANLDQDYEIILKRLTKLGKQVVRGRRRETERSDTSAIITTAVESINEIKRIVENMQSMQQEIYKMRSKMKEYELKSRTIQHLSGRVIELENRLRTHCRSVISMNESLINNHNYGEHSKGHNDVFRRIS